MRGVLRGMSLEFAEGKRERIEMVRQQIAARGVRDARVLEAMRRVPRHCFVSADLRREAYADHPLRIGHGQTISQPYMVALMTEQLELTPADKVLEIGTGSAYQAAVLAELAAKVVTVERHADLASQARLRLQELQYDNVTVITGDGTQGHTPESPYDAIIVTAGSPRIPVSLRAQLNMGGRLVCPVGSREVQMLSKLVRDGHGDSKTVSTRCVFVPLIGRDAW